MGARRLGSNSTAQYVGLLDGTYRVGAMLMNQSSASSYDTLLTPGERTISFLSSATTTITTTLYFGQPNATTTFTLTGGVPRTERLYFGDQPELPVFRASLYG